MSKVSMDEASLQICDVCGAPRTREQGWFLLADSSGEDKLQIFQSDGESARRRNTYCACSPAHVQEMVVHWMTCGSLDVPFAALHWDDRTEVAGGSKLPWKVNPDTRGLRLVGELMIDRASVSRIIEENPESLQTILDELSDTLQRETDSALARFESAAGMNAGSLRHV